MRTPKIVGGPARDSAGTVAAEDSALADLGISTDDEDAALADLGVGAPSTIPAGHRETGAQSLRTELPETTFEATPGIVSTESRQGGATTQGPGGHVAVEREVERDLPRTGEQVQPDERSPFDRIRSYISGADPEALGTGWNAGNLGEEDESPSFAGIEAPSLPSIRRAIAGDDPMSALPTAPREGSGVGHDARGQAPAIGAVQALMLEHGDELGGLVGGRQRRDDLRAQQGRAEEQAPGAYALGSVAGSLPYAAIPGGAATAGGRVGIATGLGLGLGTARGAGEAEEWADVPREAVEGGLVEGALSGGLGSLGEAAVPLARGAARAAGEAMPGMRDRMNHAALEARGIWGRRSMQAARERPGGVERLAGQLDDAGFPLDARRSPARIDEILGESGPEIGRVRGAIDDAGERVDTQAVSRRLVELAEQEERAPIGGRQRGRALRGFAGDIGGLENMSFGDAHQQRRTIDEMITRFSPDPNMSSIAGQRQTVRQIVSDEMGTTANAAGLGDEWADANRNYALGAFMDDYGRGAERLNSQGGMGGAMSRARGIGRMATGDIGGAAEALGAPGVQQEARMRIPGLQVRAIRRVLPMLRAGGPALQRAARVLEQAQQQGPSATAAAHFILSRQSPEYRAAAEQAREGEE